MIFKNMSIQTIFILVLIGVAAGMLSGFVGVGGGIIIVPALTFFLGLGQLQAQGTSLFVILLPVGILAVMNYYKQGQVNIGFGLVVAAAFLLGGYLGSKLSLKMSPHAVKFVFGLVMMLISIKLIVSGYNAMTNER
jgi:uncharacterized protein